MSFPPLLLRILLSLSLILNGSGFALASGHLQMPGHASIDVGAGTAHGMPQAQVPCHDEGGVASIELVHHSSTAGQADSGHDARHSGPDCCESGGCRCACLHGSVVAMSATIRGAFASMRETAVRPLVSAYPAPMLPDLIRPPIG